MANAAAAFFHDNSIRLAELRGPADLFCAMRDFCPGRTSIIEVDSIEVSAAYMDIFRALARLASIEGEIARVIAERSKISQEIVEFSFFFENNKHSWIFSGRSKYLSDDFMKMACDFLGAHGTQSIVQASEPGAPFLELISVPPLVATELHQAGMSFGILVNCSQ